MSQHVLVMQMKHNNTDITDNNINNDIYACCLANKCRKLKSYRPHPLRKHDYNSKP